MKRLVFAFAIAGLVPLTLSQQESRGPRLSTKAWRAVESIPMFVCRGAPARATAGTIEEVLATCSLPAGLLSTNGMRLEVEFLATTAANANNKQVRVRVGGLAGTLVADSTAAALNDRNVITTEPVVVSRLSATTATTRSEVAHNANASAAAATVLSAYTARAASITWANALDVVITGTTATSAGDLTLQTFSVSVHNVRQSAELISPSGSGTANTLTKWSGATGLTNSSPLQSWDVVSNDNTQNFLRVTGTLPAIPSADVVGVLNNITSAGSAARSQYGTWTALQPGYTGANNVVATYVETSALGTNTTYGNNAFQGFAYGVTTGTNRGIHTEAYGGNLNVAGSFLSDTTGKANSTHIGVQGFATNTGTNGIKIGGYFGLQQGISTPPTFESAALIADNAAVDAPIFLGRDNGTVVSQVSNGGSQWAKMATKTLTESSATLFVRVDVASDGRQGGVIEYCVDADDATDFQTRCGSVPISGVNKAGTETCNVGTASESVSVSVGTLTVTFDTETAGTNQCGYRANAVSSLTQTTLRLNYTVRLFGNAATAATAQ